MGSRLWIATACILGALGVALGAFHAHGLEQRLVASGLADDLVQRMEWFGTSVRYLMMHTLALLCVGILLRGRTKSLLINAAGVMFLTGVVLFCGSLIGLCFSLRDGLERVAPLGGGTLVLAWLTLGVAGAFLRDAAET